MNIQHLLLLLLRFINPYVPAAPLDIPEIVIESPAYIHLETGETIYLEEGQDGTDVDMAELDLYE